MKKSIPSIILTVILFAIWQVIAMRMNASYILPSPIEIVKKIWELRDVLFTVHLPATMGVTSLGLVISIVLEISERCEVTIKDISSSLVKQDGNNYLRVVFKLSSLDRKAINFFLDELKRELKPAELKVLN